MSDWSIIDKIYLYDGTFEGLLTITFKCFIEKAFPQKIYNTSEYIENFLYTTISINTDIEKSTRIWNGILKNISYDTLYISYYAFLSNEKDKEINIVKYICNGFIIGPKINNMLTLPYVNKSFSMKEKVLKECHKLKGLVRFAEMENNIFYSSIHPDNNIIEPLGKHFTKRLSNQNFIIHDKTRNTFFLYNCKQYQIIESDIFNISSFSEKEAKYQELWKTFFNTISIKERKNSRLQMQYMPKKYWQDLIELK